MAKRFDPETREMLLAHLRAGMRRGAASEVLGIPRAQLDSYLGDHPDYELEVRAAEDDAVEHVEEALYQAAVSGNVVACKLWLDRVGGARRPADPEDPERPRGEMASGGALGRMIDDAVGS